MATKLNIADWFAMEQAFSYNAANHHAYLDLQTGEVRSLRGDQLRDEIVLQEFAADSQRFLHIESVPSRDQHRWMVKFAASLEDAKMRQLLERALTMPGAFRQFNDALHEFEPEWRRWRATRAALLRERILVWLAERDLIVDEPLSEQGPGSGALGVSDEHVGALRVAYGYLDKLSVAELEHAIAYLRHVHYRCGTL